MALAQQVHCCLPCCTFVTLVFSCGIGIVELCQANGHLGDPSLGCSWQAAVLDSSAFSECLWGTSPEELKLMVSEIDECAGLPFPIEWKALQNLWRLHKAPRFEVQMWVCFPRCCVDLVQLCKSDTYCALTKAFWCVLMYIPAGALGVLGPVLIITIYNLYIYIYILFVVPFFTSTTGQRRRLFLPCSSFRSQER